MPLGEKMNLQKLRQELNIPADVAIVDAETFMLSLLLRDNALGYAINEQCIEDYQNAVVDFMQKRNAGCYFTFLSEETNRLIEEKMLGLHYNTKIKLSSEELDTLANQAKQSPCINVYMEGEGYSYQVDHSVLQEVNNPGLYNAAIKEWSGNPYYTYLVCQVAKDHTVDGKTRRRLNEAGTVFAETTFEENKRDYVESYILTDECRLQADDSERTRQESQVVGFYEMLKKAAQAPEYVPAIKLPEEQ